MTLRAAELAIAARAVRSSVSACRRVASTLDLGTLQKSDRSPVTIADFASQALVVRSLLQSGVEEPLIAEETSASFADPAHAAVLARVVGVVAEEVPGTTAEQIVEWIDRGGSRAASPRFWTLDPIDGTKGFVRREQYAVALALIENGRVVVAALGCPEWPDASGSLFLAADDSSTTRSSLREGAGPPIPVSVSDVDDVRRARICESVEKAHSSHEQTAQLIASLGIDAAPVRLDSQTKYGVLAEGSADLYLRLPTRKDYQERIWDHAAGALVVESAGGRVTDLDGRPLDYSHGDRLAGNRGVVASNGRFHDTVLETLARIVPAASSRPHES